MRWALPARSNPDGGGPSRRHLLLGAAGLAGGLLGSPARAQRAGDLSFDDLYEASGVLGLKFAPKMLALKGKSVRMQGYMAPPLKPESEFFVLTRQPVTICPFCSSDADWPTDIVVVYLLRAATPTRFSDPIEVIGTLEVGSWTDPLTGFVSQIRLVQSGFRIV
jgi:hypothetical protein